MSSTPNPLKIVMQMSKVRQRKRASRKQAKALLQQLVSGQSEVYSVFRQLYAIWCGNNAAVQELRPMFRMEGIEPDGFISVTDEFNQRVKALAAEILPGFEETPN